MYISFPKPEKKAFARKQIFHDLYEKYSTPLFGILLKLTGNDELLAADLLEKAFVEDFFPTNSNIQTTGNSFIVLLRATVKVAIAHGYSSQSITSLLVPKGAIVNQTSHLTLSIG